MGLCIIIELCRVWFKSSVTAGHSHGSPLRGGGGGGGGVEDGLLLHHRTILVLFGDCDLNPL